MSEIIFKDGAVTPLGVGIAVATTVVAAVMIDRYFFNSKDDLVKEYDEKLKALANERDGAKELAHQLFSEKNEAISRIQAVEIKAEVEKAKVEIEKAKNELEGIKLSNEKKSLDEKLESLKKLQQDVQNDQKALHSLEKRLKATATP